MTECRLVLARAAQGAGARIDAVRVAHLARLRRMAEAGELILGIPLLDGTGAYGGSLMLVTTDSLDGYLREEPFREAGIWEAEAIHPFRIAPLPYSPLPQAGPVPTAPTHSVAIGWDGEDPEAPARRLSVREAHLARVRPAAEAGILVLGGAILDAPGGAMIGSVAVTAHPDPAEARAWWAEDPYMACGVWRRTEWHATRIAPLPYRPLPGAA